MIVLTQKEKVLQLAANNDGVLLTKQVTAAGYTRDTLRALIDDGLLLCVQRGVYVTDSGYVDDYFLLQHLFKQGIFSHETALFLLGYSDRVPMNVVMTFRYGTQATRVKDAGVFPVMVSHYFEIGRSMVVRSGQEIWVYDIERTLVDLLKPRYAADYEQLIPAIKKYAGSEERDINKLFRYAKRFGVEDQMRQLIGVLL